MSGEEQAAVEGLRRCIREDFPEEVTPKLRPEAGVGVTWQWTEKQRQAQKDLLNLGMNLEFDPRVMEAMDWFEEVESYSRGPNVERGVESGRNGSMETILLVIPWHSFRSCSIQTDCFALGCGESERERIPF